MRVRRLGDNEIRCALTEAEIQEMGFDIEEIIENRDITQQFMRLVIRRVEEEEHINMDNVSPIVKAELQQDHTMTITFGGEEEGINFRDIMNKMGRLLDELKPEQVAGLGTMSVEEKEEIVDDFMRRVHMEEEALAEAERPKEKVNAEKKRSVEETMVCALRFADMETMTEMSRVCFTERIPKSSLYRLDGSYYLIMDFSEFEKAEMRTFAFGALEYDDAHESEPGRLAYIQEHGKNIIKNDALQMLMQL